MICYCEHTAESEESFCSDSTRMGWERLIHPITVIRTFDVAVLVCALRPLTTIPPRAKQTHNNRALSVYR